MNCPVCSDDHYRGPRGLSRYRALLQVGVINPKTRKLTPPPKPNKLFLRKETPTKAFYHCQRCQISVLVLKDKHVTNDR
jgi:hypothetical protein